MRLYEDLTTVRARLGVFQTGLIIAFGALLAYFWSLQVLARKALQGGGREEQDEACHSGCAARADSRPQWTGARGEPALVQHRPRLPSRVDDLDRTVARLARALGMGEATIRERIERRESTLQPVVVRPDATLAEVAAVEARRFELPEVSVEVVPLRSYPLAAAAAHALGRVGQVSERQLKTTEYQRRRSGHSRRPGRARDTIQRAVSWVADGYRKVIVNSRGSR